MREFIRIHKVALLLSVVTGLISVMPYLLAPFALGSEYKGVPFFYQDSEEAYLARIGEIVQGEYGATSPFFYEYKETKKYQQPYGEWFFAAPAIVTGISIETVLLWYKFLLPGILFFLVYFLLFRILTMDRESRLWTALLGATLVLFGFEFANPAFIFELLSGNPYLSIWTRPVNPITGALLLFSFLHALVSLYQKERFLWILVAGVLIGLQSGYIFSFVLSGLILSGALLVALLAKQYRLARAYFIAGLLGIVLNAPYILSVAQSAGGDTGLEKTGLFNTYHYLWNTALFLTLLLFMVALPVLKFAGSRIQDTIRERWYLWALIGILSSIVALNLQVIVGKAVWPQHFVQYTIPVAFLALTILAASVFERFGYLRAWRGVSVFGVVLLFTTISLTVANYDSLVSDFLRRQEMSPVRAWIKDDALGNCVILPVEKGDFWAYLLPGYNPCDGYISPYVYVAVPDDRIKHNIFVSLRIGGVTPDTVEAYLDEHQEIIQLYLFRNWYDRYYTQADPWLARVGNENDRATYFVSREKELVDEYNKFYTNDFEQELKRYKLDYVVWDRSSYPEWDPQSMTFLSEPKTSGNLVLFTVQ